MPLGRDLNPGKDDLKVIWCRRCAIEFDREDIKPGTFSCPKCRRSLEFNLVLRPEGTIRVKYERDVSEWEYRRGGFGRIESPQEFRKMAAIYAEEDRKVFDAIRLAGCPEGCICVWDDADISGENNTTDDFRGDVVEVESH